MNTPSIFNFNDTHQVRVVELNGQPWFVAKDVCLCLGMDARAGTTNLLRNLASDEKQRVTPKTMTLNTDTRILFGGAGMLTLISESGLYKLIMRSDKPEAKAFQDWVTRDVLPAIRKDGGYVKGEEKVASGEMSEDELVLKALPPQWRGSLNVLVYIRQLCPKENALPDTVMCSH